MAVFTVSSGVYALRHLQSNARFVNRQSPSFIRYVIQIQGCW